LILLTPIISMLIDIVISLLPILELMNIPLMLSVKILNLFLPLLELLTPLIKILTPIFELLALVLRPVVFLFELIADGVDTFVDLISGAFSPMEVFIGILDGIKIAFDYIMIPINLLIDGVQYLWGIVDPFTKLSEVLDPIVGFFSDIWGFIESIVDGIADIVGSFDIVGDIGDGISDFLGFETGTGLSGVPKTSLYQLHEGEIVLNPDESDSLREAEGVNSGLLRSNPQTSTTQNSGITIGNIEVHANSEAEGRDAVRGVMKELESLNVRGDVEVL